MGSRTVLPSLPGRLQASALGHSATVTCKVQLWAAHKPSWQQMLAALLFLAGCLPILAVSPGFAHCWCVHLKHLLKACQCRPTIPTRPHCSLLRAVRLLSHHNGQRVGFPTWQLFTTFCRQSSWVALAAASFSLPAAVSARGMT